MEKKYGFFKLKKHVAVALITFIAISAVAYTPMVTNSMTAGLSNTAWVISLLALAVPTFCIITGHMSEKNK